MKRLPGVAVVRDFDCRLIREERDSSLDTEDYSIDYVLDLVGNRLRQTTTRSTSVQRVNYQYNARDQLFAETGESAASLSGPWSALYQSVYGYDAQGNQRSKIRTGSLPETTTYGFDVRNRLTGMTSTRTLSGGDVEHLTASYGYDSQGIRTRVTETRSINAAAAQTTSTTYLTDHHSPTGYAQAIEERTTTAEGTTVAPPAPTGLPSVTYVFGFELVSQARAAAGQTQPVTSIYLQDAHSGVRQLVAMAAPAGSPEGTPPPVTDTYVYEAFGTLLSSAHSTAGETLNTHLYRAEVFDSGLGFTYLRARYLDSTTGRFTAQDPYEGDLVHPLTLPDYWYAAADGVNKVDPSGEFYYAVLARVAALVYFLSPSVADAPGTQSTPVSPAGNWSEGVGPLHHTIHTLTMSIPAPRSNKYTEEQLETMLQADLYGFTYFNDGRNNIARVKVDPETHIARFDLLGWQGSGSDIINDDQVAVQLTQDSGIVSGQTLAAHQVVGVRKWFAGVHGTPDTGFIIDVRTEGYEQARTWLNFFGGETVGRQSQMEVWKAYLLNIADAYGRKLGAWYLNLDQVHVTLGDQQNPWQP